MDEFKLIQGFRYFNVYGEGEDHKEDQASPIHKFAKQIKETGKLKLCLKCHLFLFSTSITVLPDNFSRNFFPIKPSLPVSIIMV